MQKSNDENYIIKSDFDSEEEYHEEIRINGLVPNAGYMDRFATLNPQLCAIASQETIAKIKMKIESFIISTTSFQGFTRRVILQPKGQSLFIFASDTLPKFTSIDSAPVPLNMSHAKDNLEWGDIPNNRNLYLCHGGSEPSEFRTFYFHQQGISLQSQINRHHELIISDLVDATVFFLEEGDQVKLVDIFVGDRFSTDYV